MRREERRHLRPRGIPHARRTAARGRDSLSRLCAVRRWAAGRRSGSQTSRLNAAWQRPGDTTNLSHCRPARRSCARARVAHGSCSFRRVQSTFRDDVRGPALDRCSSRARARKRSAMSEERSADSQTESASCGIKNESWNGLTGLGLRDPPAGSVPRRLSSRPPLAIGRISSPTPAICARAVHEPSVGSPFSAPALPGRLSPKSARQSCFGRDISGIESLTSLGRRHYRVPWTPSDASKVYCSRTHS